jgi:hypothetical protein
MSSVVEKVKAKVEQVLHKDSTHTTGSHTTGTHTTGTHTTGTHTTGHSTNAGPHDSNIANKADPRVDSDRDGSRNAGAANYGPGATHSGPTGTYGGHGHSTNAGPHDSNLLNKADPRVDSDRDGSRNAGAANYGPGATHSGTHTGTHAGTHTAGGGITSGTGTTATNNGPHNSNLLNKADPRVDSDHDGSRNFGAASHGAHSGTGPAHGTAGPHSSNLANKLDPRVDSDLDGSKTVGNQNQTY